MDAADTLKRRLERDRLNGICRRLAAWSKEPTLSVSQTLRLTGLSRTRLCQLIQTGVFSYGRETENREVLLETVLQYFARRVSKLSKAGRFPRKGLTKV
jgi:hypothetical protein